MIAFPVASGMDCAVCGRRLDPTADMALIEVTLRRAGSHRPTTYRMYACGSAHAAEAMRRIAALVDSRAFAVPEPGSDEWCSRAGVLVRPRKEQVP